jgi:hypothetical protein
MSDSETDLHANLCMDKDEMLLKPASDATPEEEAIISRISIVNSEDASEDVKSPPKRPMRRFVPSPPRHDEGYAIRGCDSSNSRATC